MTINRSVDLSKTYTHIYINKRIICDFLPENFPAAASPASSHLFNHKPEDKPYDRIKYLSIINIYLSIIMAIMYLARLTRPDVLLATSHLDTKDQHPKEVIIKQLFVLSPI